MFFPFLWPNVVRELSCVFVMEDVCMEVGGRVVVSPLCTMCLIFFCIFGNFFFRRRAVKLIIIIIILYKKKELGERGGGGERENMKSKIWNHPFSQMDKTFLSWLYSFFGSNKRFNRRLIKKCAVVEYYTKVCCRVTKFFRSAFWHETFRKYSVSTDGLSSSVDVSNGGDEIFFCSKRFACWCYCTRRGLIPEEIFLFHSNSSVKNINSNLSAKKGTQERKCLLCGRIKEVFSFNDY